MAAAPRPDAPDRLTELNRAGSIDEQLRYAIANRLLVQIVYDGSTRLIEPHDYGVQSGATRLLAFQRRRSGGAPGKSLFELSKIQSCIVLVDTFRGTRGDPAQDHYVWDVLHARVT
jgi:hypothetical protein